MVFLFSTTNEMNDLYSYLLLTSDYKWTTEHVELRLENTR